MSNITNLLENRFIDYLRGQAPAAIATLAWALIVATRGYSNTIRSQAVSLNDTVLPATPNGRIYRCTTAGTAGAGEPTWPTTDGGTVVDGTVTWTEQTLQLDAGVFTEVANAGNYTRASVAASLANLAGTQGAGTTVARLGHQRPNQQQRGADLRQRGAVGQLGRGVRHDGAGLGHLRRWQRADLDGADDAKDREQRRPAAHLPGGLVHVHAGLRSACVSPCWSSATASRRRRRSPSSWPAWTTLPPP
jgi:hypothetical protein